MSSPGCWRHSRNATPRLTPLLPSPPPLPPEKASDAGTLWRGLSARLASVRHLALAADSADNEVIDPYKRGPEVYRQMEDELAPAILTILRYARLNTPT